MLSQDMSVLILKARTSAVERDQVRKKRKACVAVRAERRNVRDSELHVCHLREKVVA